MTPLESNRETWDRLTGVHLQSDFYDVPGFRAGTSSLNQLERDLVGSVSGQRLLHLQCHFGIDTLSWARLGAVVTGVDFSAAAIAAASALAREAGLAAEFVQADVQDLPRLPHRHEIVVSTYGVLCWLELLDAWAAGIRCALRPGGRFVLVDFHPILEALHPGKMTGARGYFGAPRLEPTWTEGSYADPRAPIRYPEYRWQHPIGDVVSAIANAGLDVVELREYPYSSYRLFDELDHFADGAWRASAGQAAAYPYMFSLVARKPR